MGRKKKAKLSKEEKELVRKQKELEARKEFKRKELKREIAAHARKKDEVDKGWVKMMLKIKEPFIRNDLEATWKTYDRALNKRDHQMRYLMKLMDAAENQMQYTVAYYSDVIDTMIRNFFTDIEKLTKENEMHINECITSGKGELNKIANDQKLAEDHLQLATFDAHTKADTLAWMTRGIHLVKQDEERNQYENERDSLRSLLENSYSNMWDDFKAVLKSYIVNTAETQKEARKLRQKDHVMAEIIGNQALQIKNSDETLKRLQSELSEYDSGTKQAVFRDRRDKYRNACQRLKKMLSDDCDLDDKQLGILVNESNDAIEWLEAGYKKGDKLLRLAAVCRKFETQREKILPFENAIPHDNESVKTHSENSLIKGALSYTSGLTRLWQKITNAELSKKALLHEKRQLEAENSFLIETIQKSEEMTLGFEQNACPCNERDGDPPVAIEGDLELRKYYI
ncbi:dynein regulatory complex subunit 2-like [Aricia agestis]|uniref:dynein regulatory complex subunit 2-like n=1 Tax=Aricia agestis TaxID=91739 RepID=UPI001C2049E5|nr:dynein regulatory complex subunit 2-like [Aricia agestis]